MTRREMLRASGLATRACALSGEAPTACRHTVAGTLSLPSSGCFSPFHHCTSSLSVDKEYLGLDRGRPTFRQDFTCPALLKELGLHYAYGAITRYGAVFQQLLLVFPKTLAWSAFARHY